MTENNKFLIGIFIAVATNIGGVAYMLGGVDATAKSMSDSINQVKNGMVEMQNDIDSLKTKVFTIKESTSGNGIVIQRVDNKVSEINGTVRQHENRIGIIEFKTGIHKG